MGVIHGLVPHLVHGGGVSHLQYADDWLEAMALGYALTELRIFPMGKTQGEKKVLGRNVLFVRAFFLAKANNLAAIEF